MQITEKYLIIASFIFLPLALGLMEHQKINELIRSRSELYFTEQKKCSTDTSIIAKPKTSEKNGSSDTILMDSKIWMLKQNMIIGY
jgi:hypothetical protein